MIEACVRLQQGDAPSIETQPIPPDPPYVPMGRESLSVEDRGIEGHYGERTRYEDVTDDGHPLVLAEA